MPTINLKDSNKVKIKVTTRYESILDDFNEKIELEEKKYPLTDREQIFVETIKELLQTLDTSARRW
jgi:hypothetical protein